MSEHPLQVSLAEKLDLIPAFVSITLAALNAAVEYPFRGSNKADTFYHHIVHAIVRKFSKRLSVPQARWMEPSFNATYRKWCTSHNTHPSIVSITPQTNGFWLGSPSSKTILVFFHGGGFAFPANDGHLKFLSSIMDSMKARGRSLSVLMVDYPLTPLATFPSQFQEAVNAVRYVVETCNYQPSQIILGGDSAGGNLAASVILHCLRPSEHVPPLSVVVPKNKFKGLVLISPWVSFDITLASFTHNPNKDYVLAETEKRWSDSYLSKDEPCIYNEPCLASAAVWKDMPVQDVLVTAGADELLIDGITKWVDDIKVHNTNVMYNIAQHEPHEAPIIWSAFGDRHVTETERKVEAWLQSLFEKAQDD